MRALANDQPVAPRKVRLVLDMVRGRTVDEALSLLEFMPQPSARIVWKVIKSAAANAENNFDLNPDGLKIKSCLLYTSPSPRDGLLSRMPSSA